MVIVASLAGYDQHPAWVHNLRANPKCWVQLDRRKMTTATRVTRPTQERKALWPRLVALLPLWELFQKQTDRPFPIVILTPTGAGLIT